MLGDDSVRIQSETKGEDPCSHVKVIYEHMRSHTGHVLSVHSHTVWEGVKSVDPLKSVKVKN